MAPMTRSLAASATQVQPASTGLEAHCPRPAKALCPASAGDEPASNPGATPTPDPVSAGSPDQRVEELQLILQRSRTSVPNPHSPTASSPPQRSANPLSEDSAFGCSEYNTLRFCRCSSSDPDEPLASPDEPLSLSRRFASTVSINRCSVPASQHLSRSSPAAAMLQQQLYHRECMSKAEDANRRASRHPLEDDIARRPSSLQHNSCFAQHAIGKKHPRSSNG